MLRGKNLRPKTRHPAKASLRTEGERRKFADKQKLKASSVLNRPRRNVEGSPLSGKEEEFTGKGKIPLREAEDQARTKDYLRQYVDRNAKNCKSNRNCTNSKGINTKV